MFCFTVSVRQKLRISRMAYSLEYHSICASSFLVLFLVSFQVLCPMYCVLWSSFLISPFTASWLFIKDIISPLNPLEWSWVLHLYTPGTAVSRYFSSFSFNLLTLKVMCSDYTIYHHASWYCLLDVSLFLFLKVKLRHIKIFKFLRHLDVSVG